MNFNIFRNNKPNNKPIPVAPSEEIVLPPATIDISPEESWVALTLGDFQQLKEADIPDDVLIKLEPIQSHVFSTEEQLVIAFRRLLGREWAEEYTERLLQSIQVAYYYYTAAGKSIRRDFKDYILFIDLGSYRTSVLCWPYLAPKSTLTSAWRYIVNPFPDDPHGKGFPSAFYHTENEANFRFVPDIASIRDHVMEHHIIPSAKIGYVCDYASKKGNVPTFRLYIKKVLEKTLTYITEPVEGRVWNDAFIPRIVEIRVTVPDLFIENLRQGYKRNIGEVCLELAQYPRWRALFPYDLADKLKTFVNLSSDESGACELYFVNLLRTLPFVNLSQQRDSKADMQKVEAVFVQNNAPSAKAGERIIAQCHLDIGGLTTDASIVLLRAYLDEYLGITTTLWHKESFSEKKAGELFKQEYAQMKDFKPNIPWWESENFVNSHITHFVETIVRKQYSLLQQWKDLYQIHGVYFIISGRPTRAKLVQKAILQQIIKIFNQEEVMLLPDHCLFIANYRHVGKDPNGGRYAQQIDDFEKMITLLGNVYTMHEGYDIDIQKQEYYISLDLDMDGVKSEPINVDQEYDMQDRKDYKRASEAMNVVSLAFSKHPDDTSKTTFLLAKKLAGQVVFPKIKIVKDTIDQRAWIMPTIAVTNLEEHPELELAWAYAMLDQNQPQASKK